MFCKYCGTELDNGALFCTKCGRSQQMPTNQQVNTLQNTLKKEEKKGFSITALVLGITGFIAWLIPLLGFPITIVGIILGISGLKKGGKGMAIAGIILASITLLLTTANSAIGFFKGYNGLLWFQQESSKNDSDMADTNKTENESKVFKVVSQAKISEDDMDAIVYNLQRRAENFTTEAVVLMKNRKSEWYVEISMPGVDESAYKEVVYVADLKFIGGYGAGNEEIIVTNENIKSAAVSTVETSTGNINYVVNISFDDEGAKAFAKGTEKYIGKTISIVLDGKRISSPVVSSVITGGEASINVNSYEEAYRLATLLRVGYLGFEFEETE